MAEFNPQDYGLQEEPDYSNFGLVEEQSAPAPSKKSLEDSLTEYAKQSGDSFLNTVLGVGDAVNNLFRNTSNMFMPKSMQLPMMQSGDGTGYGLGNFLGNVAGFAGGGEALDAARAGAEAAPYIGKAAQWLGGDGAQALARRMLGSGAYGAIQNPDDRLKGAAEAAATSGAFDALPVAGGDLMSAISPKKYMSTVYQSIADQLGKVTSDSSKMYGNVLDKYGNKSVSTDGVFNAKFKKDPDVMDFYKEFKSNPTVYTAHALQSQLGSEARSIPGDDLASTRTIKAYNRSRDTLKSSINSTLSGISKDAADSYSQAGQHYFENVVPYQMISDALQKIVQPTPEKVVRKIESVTKQPSYPKNEVGNINIPIVPQDITNLQDSLSSKIRNRNITQILGSAALGGTALHSFGVPIGSELLTGMALSGAAPYALRKASGNVNTINDGFSTALANALSKIYKSGSKATIANLVGGQ